MRFIQKMILSDNTIKEYIISICLNKDQELRDEFTAKISFLADDNEIYQKIESLENDLLEKCNILVDSVYSDEEFKSLKASIVEFKLALDNCYSALDSKADQELTLQLTANNIKLSKAVLDIKRQVENTQPVQIQDSTAIESLVKKTRVDTATVITKVKESVSELDIKLDAFIDTVSEKIAEIKQKNRR
jgi:hypothetical protein